MPSEILVKRLYISDCKISLAFSVLYFHLLLIRSFISIRSFFFVSWSLFKKLNSSPEPVVSWSRGLTTRLQIKPSGSGDENEIE